MISLAWINLIILCNGYLNNYFCSVLWSMLIILSGSIFLSDHIVEHKKNTECLTYSSSTLLKGFLLGWAVLALKWVWFRWRVGAWRNKTQTVSLHKDLFRACTHAWHGSGRYSQINISSIQIILAAVQSASMLELTNFVLSYGSLWD